MHFLSLKNVCLEFWGKKKKCHLNPDLYSHIPVEKTQPQGKAKSIKDGTGER